MSKWIFVFGLFATVNATVFAMDHFPLPITAGEIRAKIQDFAIVPDSSPNNPARLSVLTRDPIGRLFVNDQRGGLYRLPTAGGLAQTYLDLNTYTENPVLSTSEAGFQSFAFHPQFAQNGTPGFGRFYTMHSTTNTTPIPEFNPGG